MKDTFHFLHEEAFYFVVATRRGRLICIKKRLLLCACPDQRTRQKITTERMSGYRDASSTPLQCFYRHIKGDCSNRYTRQYLISIVQ